MEKKRYNFIDIWKAIAILFVIFYHSFLMELSFAHVTAGKAIQYFLYTILGTGVPAFFMINGFLMFGKPVKKGHYLKIARIILKTGIWAVLVLSGIMLIRGDQFLIKDFIRDLVTLKVGYINHLWFMEALVFIYVLFPFVKMVYDKAFCVYCVLTVVIILYTVILPGMISLPNVYFSFSLAHFMLGGIIYKMRDLQMKKEHRVISVACAVLCMVVQTALGIKKCVSGQMFFDNVWACYTSVFAILAVVLIMLAACSGKNKNSWPFVSEIGKNTLGIYFLHQIWINLLWAVPGVKNICGTNIVINFIFAVVVLIFSMLTVELIKRIPFVKKLVIL